MTDKTIRIYAYYLPQFHETEENNKWWGKGFTEWDNVRGAKPLFQNHSQPRVPLNKNYYDLSKPETISWQANLAREYGVSGFSIYHYWSNGTQLLSRPVNLIINNKWIDINFHLTWANHPWTRSWKNNTGFRNEILMEQNYEEGEKDREKHYEYIINIMKDSRYTQYNKKPLFNIYRPYDIPKVGQYLDGLREFATKELNQELHINSMIQYPPKDNTFTEYIDSISLFQPGTVMFNTDSLANSDLSAKNILQKMRTELINSSESFRLIFNRFRPKKIKKYHYDEVWKALLKQSLEESYLGKPIIKGAFTDWDNTARYGEEATIYFGSSPEKFRMYMRELVEIVKNSDSQEKLIFINAWNEWGESAYLEPDEEYKFSYLEAIKDSI